MTAFEWLLAIGATLIVVAWTALSAYVLSIERRRTAARTLLADARARLDADGMRQLGIENRVQHLRPLLQHASRELIMRAATERGTSRVAGETLAAYLVERWGTEQLETDASAHRTPREKWRRITSLRLLAQMSHPRAIALLARAVEGADPDVADVAIALLGSSSEPEAAQVLIQALRQQRHAPSRIAAHLDQTRVPIADRVQVLLADPNPVVRQWAAAIMGRFAGLPGIEDALEPLADDPDPRVRKAAVQSLGKVGDERAAAVALRLLVDPLPFVRANATRAIGDLDRVDLAPRVAAMLGDADWWVRRAAKESLEAMGPDVWPALVACLEHRDRFVRNSAAEVLQNLGIVDSLILMEAATDNPGLAKIEMLRRITEAGGVRFTESLVERAGPQVGPRVRLLLSTIGLAHVGTA
jgi:HEAT repeat protein